MEGSSSDGGRQQKTFSELYTNETTTSLHALAVSSGVQTVQLIHAEEIAVYRQYIVQYL